MLESLVNLGAQATFSDEGFEELFKTFDVDASGTIEKDEMAMFIKLIQDRKIDS